MGCGVLNLFGEWILVGDAKGNVIMIQAAGLIPIVVLSSHLNKREAEELNVEYIIENITLLEQVLSEINATQTS